jgi:hypothetical protein
LKPKSNPTKETETPKVRTNAALAVKNFSIIINYAPPAGKNKYFEPLDSKRIALEKLKPIK